MSNTTRTASDIKATMAASIKQAMTELRGVESLSHSTDGPNNLRDKRFTVVIPNVQHRFIKRFAIDANSDASTIARTLFAMLESDPSVAEQVRTRIHQRS